ncbi:MAG: ADP-heptose--LPS heptosyltransferase 2 [Verrucomicrobiota bacterium]|jgi:KDO2-lipid IV(A) lauroyltransferase
MSIIVYWLARLFIACVQALPLTLVARGGRAIGALAWVIAPKHRRLVLENLTLAFKSEKSAEEIHTIAKESFRRIGENMICAIKTAGMTFEALRPHLEIAPNLPLPASQPGVTLPNFVFAIGHFGNFELYARFQSLRTDYQTATTYRALKQPGLNRLMQEMRERSGCLYFERRFEGTELRTAMNRGGVILGLLGDQSSRGLRAPFLGRDCDTGLAPAVLALRYGCDLYTAFCFRTGLAKWRLEVGDKIPTHENGHARSSEDIMRDVNLSYEKAVRRDPANWFCWVHRRWKAERVKKQKKAKMENGG